MTVLLRARVHAILRTAALAAVALVVVESAPALTRWFAKVSARPSFKATAPAA